MGRLGKWAIFMMEFNITYVSQKAVKGQALADFLAAHPMLDHSPLVIDLPNEEVFSIGIESPWELYFDGASRTEKILTARLAKELGPDSYSRRRKVRPSTTHSPSLRKNAQIMKLNMRP
jgi:hypothetical protein